MKSLVRAGYVIIFFFAGILTAPQPICADPPDKVELSERCAVCGMFVAKYPNWVTQIQYAGGPQKYFDGFKDLMAHYFSPESYGVTRNLVAKEIWVKDYYSLEWIDGRAAFYVVGSDVFGPMGNEFIPFSKREAAENFLKDHKGQKILVFDDITSEMVESMRFGQKMKGHMVK